MIDSITEMSATQQAIELAQLRHDHLLAEMTAGIEALDAEVGLDLEEALIVIDVSDAQNGEGNPLYGNAERRAAEVKQRMLTDPALQPLQRRIVELKERAKRNRIDAEYAGDRLKIILAFAGGER